MKKYTIRLLFISLILFSTSCGEEFLDINEDPNNPTTAPLGGLLSNIELATAGTFGGTGLTNYTHNIMGYMCTRGNLMDYGLTGQDFGVTNNWNTLYRSPLQDIVELESQARASSSLKYLGIGLILKAYIYAGMVDLWGDVPFTEANRGAEIPSPRYDNGAVIYDSCFAFIDRGIANLQQGDEVLSGDLIFNNDVDSWVRAGRTLKLRLATQARLVTNPTSRLSDFNPATDLLATDLEFQYGSSSNPDNRNPLYAEEWGPAAANRYIDPFFFEVMTGQNSFFPNETNPYVDGESTINDPRVPYYFYNQLGPGDTPENPPAYLNGFFLSIYKFSFNIDPNEGFDQASSATVVGLYPAGGAYDDGSGTNTNFNGSGDIPQRLLTIYNAYFNLAELANEGITFANGGDARTNFELGVRAAFAKVNEYANGAGAPVIDAAVVDNYVTSVLGLYDAAASAEERLEIIMIEKWKANFGLGTVAYNDYRRTGYPVLHDGNTDDLDVTDRTRDFPLSLPYNTNSLNVNSNAPSQRTIATDRVFWDN